MLSFTDPTIDNISEYILLAAPELKSDLTPFDPSEFLNSLDLVEKRS